MQRYRLSASGSGAWQPGDEVAAREQLQVLAAEATLLSRMTPRPMPSAPCARVRISAECEARAGEPPDESPEPVGVPQGQRRGQGALARYVPSAPG